MTGPRQVKGSIRLAGESDVSQLARLLREEAEFEAGFSQGDYSYGPEFNWVSFAESALTRSNTALFVYASADTVSGLIYGRIVRTPEVSSRPWPVRAVKKLRRRSQPLAQRNLHYVMIDHVYVKPAHRRSNVALGLFNAITHWAREQGAHELRGLTWAQNEQINRFVQAIGFRALRTMYRKPIQSDK